MLYIVLLLKHMKSPTTSTKLVLQKQKAHMTVHPKYATQYIIQYKKLQCGNFDISVLCSLELR